MSKKACKLPFTEGDQIKYTGPSISTIKNGETGTVIGIAESRQFSSGLAMQIRLNYNGCWFGMTDPTINWERVES